MKINRTYKYKDADMLLASKTISQTFLLNLSELSIARSSWTQEYATALATKIDSAIDNFMGLDKKKELRDATASLVAIQVPAMRDLSFVKTQIEVDFGKNATEVIKVLGFDKNWRSVQKKDQEALIELLYSFKKGLTPELKTQIIEKGTNSELLDRIVAYADQMLQVNVSQESLKETTKEISGEALTVFNETYEQVIGICKIASSFYQYEPLKKEQFTFSKVIKNMNSAKNK